MLAVLDVLRVCNLNWRNRGIPRNNRYIGIRKNIRNDLEANVSFFSRRDIWEAVFKPASHYCGKSNWFAFIQHQEYSDGHISGSF